MLDIMYIVGLRGFTMTPAQCAAARALLGWNQAQLADNAGVSRQTVVGFESGRRNPNQASMDGMLAALIGSGMEFIGHSGVVLRDKVN